MMPIIEKIRIALALNRGLVDLAPFSIRTGALFGYILLLF